MSFATRTVSEVMQSHFVALQATDRLDFADQVMRLGRIRHLPVMADGRLVGMVSNRDILAASLTKVLDFARSERNAFLHAIDVSEVMTSRVYTVTPQSRLAEAAHLLLRHKIGCLPVVDAKGALVGILTETDLLRAAYDEGGAREGEAEAVGAGGATPAS
jgi:acetoin utilization protein AcuB